MLHLDLDLVYQNKMSQIPVDSPADFDSKGLDEQRHLSQSLAVERIIQSGSKPGSLGSASRSRATE